MFDFALRNKIKYCRPNVTAICHYFQFQFLRNFPVVMVSPGNLFSDVFALMYSLVCQGTLPGTTLADEHYPWVRKWPGWCPEITHAM